MVFYFSNLLASWYKIKGCSIEFFPLASPNLNVSFLHFAVLLGIASAAHLTVADVPMCVLGPKVCMYPSDKEKKNLQS